MPERAHVTSLDALEAFRSNLIVYLSQARPALDEISAEVVRTRAWLEHDRRSHWDKQFRRRSKALEEAQQALFTARIGVLSKETVMEQLAVQRAKQALAEADQKLGIIKNWDREFDGRVQPLVKQIEKLQTVLSHDMVKAVTYLTRAIGTLAAYAEKAQPGLAAAATTPVTEPGAPAATGADHPRTGAGSSGTS